MTETFDGGEGADAIGKEKIYHKVKELVRSRTGGRDIGKTGGREVFDFVVAEIFALAAKEGYLRLNGGFGSFHVRHYGAGQRRTPAGQMVEFGDREKVRYEEGVVVKALILNKGDLAEALKVKGSHKEEATAAGLPPSLTKKAEPAAA